MIPGLYLLANAAIAVAMLIGRPRECLISLALLCCGLPFYWLFSKWSAATARREGAS